MKTPDVERVTRKPGEIELNREPRETKKKTMISNSRKKKSEKQRRRERERAEHATTVHAKYDTTEQWPESKKVFRKHGAFPATSKWNRRLDKEPKVI
jgi:hypothetical protein